MSVRIRKVLVANRGEIARRVLRTVRAMGLAGVAVYSDADEHAPHVADADEAVRIGPPPSRESYLAIDRILAAARATGADAIHPGYGFLSENAEFAARVAEAGLVFIGPPVEAIRRMGSKIGAKEIMAAAGVPVVPGASLAELPLKESVEAARTIGFPILIKASAGGGGKGMRIVRDEGGLTEAIATARREAESAFGDGTLLIERYFDAPRHIEIQIFGDVHGDVIHLGERECSIQRRYQKVIEEAPSPAVDAALRTRMGEAAVAAARAIGYVGAGTVEFIVDQQGEFYFLEVNTRLQVEHPVTEAVTGLDLVRWQILLAEGERLPLRQADVALDGHAIEARLYAEDPANDFLPATGARGAVGAARRSRESATTAGSSAAARSGCTTIRCSPRSSRTPRPATRRSVGSGARSRRSASARSRPTAISWSPCSTTPRSPPASCTPISSRSICPRRPGRAARDPSHDRIHAAVAALYEHARRRARAVRCRRASRRAGATIAGARRTRASPSAASVSRSATSPSPRDASRSRSATTRSPVACSTPTRPPSPSRSTAYAAASASSPGDGALVVHGPLGTATLTPVPRFPPAEREDLAGGCMAPMTGIIRDVRVKEGDRVEKGTILLVLEAMKMEHQMVARDVGVVKQVRVEVGQMVDPDEVLVVVEPLTAD